MNFIFDGHLNINICEIRNVEIDWSVTYKTLLFQSISTFYSRRQIKDFLGHQGAEGRGQMGVK